MSHEKEKKSALIDEVIRSFIGEMEKEIEDRRMSIRSFIDEMERKIENGTLEQDIIHTKEWKMQLGNLVCIIKERDYYN